MNGTRRPSWRKPSPLGYGPALDAATNIAAPLLAGFSITVIATVALASDRFRWPGPALLTLTLAAVVLVASLQSGFHGRQHLYSGADVAAWWSEDDLKQPGELERRQSEQYAHFECWERSSGRARRAYNAGIVLLAIGVALVLAPPLSADHAQAVFRWVAAAIAVAGALGELALSVIPPVLSQLERRRLLRSVTAAAVNPSRRNHA